MRFLIFILFSLLVQHGIAQEKWIPLDLQSRIALAQKSQNHVILAEYFLGKPYVANALSAENPEKLYLSLEDFDCVTFIENVMSLYQSKGQDSLYKKNLIHWRYTQPKDIRFETRNHYFSAAMEQLMKDKWIVPIPTHEGIQIKKSFTFLSQFYRNKNKNISIIALEQVEKNLASAPFSYIPSAKVNMVLSNLKEGDIVTFVSKRNGLDVQHTGFLTFRKSNWYLLHASQELKKVCVSDKNLVEYMKSHPSFLGIQVFRPNFIK
ncbi:N-acetylmuramoyl-L-alanine amidase-like domain-containing protein [Aquirufa beregesia]|nr:N-acetylmuramoyl-L-alanine amidase-like domain-containing protein [Aquirufa beregesia]